MKKYIYRTRDEKGRAIDGSIFAESEDEAVALIRAKGHKPEYIALSASVMMTTGSGEGAFVLERLLSEFLDDVKACIKGVPSESIALFFRQLAILTRAGFNLKRSIEVLRREVWPKPLGKALDVVDRGLNAGKPFAFLLEQSPRVFSPVFTGIIRIGENTGSIQVALEKAAQLSEEETKVRKRISTALVYPAFMLGTFLLILAGLVFYLLPMMEGIFISTGLKPPWIIRCVFSIIRLVTNPLIIAVIIELLVVLLFIYYSWIKQFNGRAVIDGALLSIPVLGPFLLNVSMARCAYNLSLLLESGMPLTRALDILPKAVGNESLARSIIYARKDIVDGNTLSESLARRHGERAARRREARSSSTLPVHFWRRAPRGAARVFPTG